MVGFMLLMLVCVRVFVFRWFGFEMMKKAFMNDSSDNVLASGCQ